MTKKRITILIVVFLALTALVFMFLKIYISDDVSPKKIQNITKEVLTRAEEVIPSDYGTNYTITSNQNFTVTYTEIDDKYTIFIQPQAREGVNQAEFEKLREEIENKFLSEVLKTNDKKLVCSLNVTIGTIGTSEPVLIPSPLSFCNK